MSALSRRFACLLLSLALVACGGGGGGGGSSATTSSSSGGTSASPPPATGAPTAPLTASSLGATGLVNLANSSSGNLTNTGGLNGVPLASSHTVLALGRTPAAGLTQSSTVACTISGSATVTATVSNTTTPTAGDTLAFVFNACSETAGITLGGNLLVTITSATDVNNFTFMISTTSLTETSGSTTQGPYSLSGSATVAAGVTTVNYLSFNGTTILGTPTVTVSGSTDTIGAGAIRVDTAGGFVEIDYSNWVIDTNTSKPTSGTATITGSGGATGVITAATSGYTVVITIGGASSTYTVPY